jgi:hypothetical protein
MELAGGPATAWAVPAHVETTCAHERLAGVLKKREGAAAWPPVANKILRLAR